MGWAPPKSTSRRRRIIVILTVLFIITYLSFLPRHSLESWHLPRHDRPSKNLACAQSPGAEDVFVIVRTGATEVHKKLPVHLKTTLRCVPDFEIFSDLEEIVEGQLVHDALDGMSPQALEHPEFDFYRKLHEHKEKGKNLTELLDQKHREEDNGQRAWNLDKWKFLPLMDKAYQMRPEAKWYIVMEADTYLMWSNILKWLQNLDPMRPLYIGGQAWGGDVEFGHGGSGIIISQRAMQMLVEKQSRNIEIFEKISAEDWFGDRALSVAFEKVGVKLTKAFPIIQGETPYTLDFTENHWCYPVGTYHHIPPSWIERLWDFEQAWHTNEATANTIIYHRNIFDHFVLPEIQTERSDWDNLSNDEQTDFHPANVEHCQAICQRNNNCVQYHFTQAKCKTSDAVRLGQAVLRDPTDGDNVKPAQDFTKFLNSPKGTSGWMVERIDEFRNRMGTCQKPWAGTSKVD